jgi:hypothetical protein
VGWPQRQSFPEIVAFSPRSAPDETWFLSDRCPAASRRAGRFHEIVASHEASGGISLFLLPYWADLGQTYTVSVA